MKFKLLLFLFLPVITGCEFLTNPDEKIFQKKEYEQHGYDIVSKNEFFASKKAENLSKKAVDLGLEGKYEDAEKILKKALDVEPNNPVILNNIGLTLYHRELFNEAIAYFNQALIVSDSSSVMAASNLGLTYYQQMDYNRALKILNYSLVHQKNDNTTMLITRLHRLMVNIELENCDQIYKDRKAVEYLRYNSQLGNFKEKIDELDKEINGLCTQNRI